MASFIANGVMRCSPLARGWSLRESAAERPGAVLPARAGMVPPARTAASRPRGAPRSRGDGPAGQAADEAGRSCSPLARGWSQRDREPVPLERVLPARAGMVRGWSRCCRTWCRAPRSRGDGPASAVAFTARFTCSPLARGWSRCLLLRDPRQSVLPARAGMVPGSTHWLAALPRAPRSRGDGPVSVNTGGGGSKCSPLARGWSQRDREPVPLERVLPARAGMVPSVPAARRPSHRAPRSRGDGPGLCSPHSCRQWCSPLARGWSRLARHARDRELVLPARAGMVPSCGRTCRRGTGAPRSRGDGPLSESVSSFRGECSPLARGWSRGGVGEVLHEPVLPARAGMVPSSSPPTPPSPCAPRSRGDGPPIRRPSRTAGRCSPLARGWSHGELPVQGGWRVLPARAGMVRSARTAERS